MRWILVGEVDVSAHRGALYILDSACQPAINRLDGKGTRPIGDQNVDEIAGADQDPRDIGADICARHAGLPTGHHEFSSIWWTPNTDPTPEPERNPEGDR
ncbi:MAG: hypothetical protein OXG35_06170 [Acidobacteria bacterium]|nr:hypothetical protein [Acidobacteriota bacterium]